MRRLLWLGLLGVAVVVVMTLGSIASFVSENALFLDSSWSTPALASLAVVVVFLLVLIGSARPARHWLASPYW